MQPAAPAIEAAMIVPRTEGPVQRDAVGVQGCPLRLPAATPRRWTSGGVTWSPAAIELAAARPRRSIAAPPAAP